MRNIKFRIWDNEKETFVDYVSINSEKGLSIDTHNKKFFQFIGSKDSVGADVYEGDILIAPSGKYFVVQWHEDEMRWAMLNNDTYYNMNMGILTVTGNIMQHSFLLNK